MHVRFALKREKEDNPMGAAVTDLGGEKFLGWVTEMDKAIIMGKLEKEDANVEGLVIDAREFNWSNGGGGTCLSGQIRFRDLKLEDSADTE